MTSAAKLWGVPVPIQKIAKAAGCEAFIGQRVKRDPLLAWVKAHPEAEAAAGNQADTAELKRQKVAWEVANLKLRHERDSGDLMPREEVRVKVAEMMAIVHDEAKNLLESDHYRIFVERVRSRFAEKGAEA